MPTTTRLPQPRTGRPEVTHQGLSPDGNPTAHRGVQGLCPAPECRASGAIALALTIQQPWADAIAYSDKRTENRSWPIPPAHVGARILIHAGKAVDRNAVLCRGSNWPDQRGVIIATARLFACHQANTRGPLCCAPWGFPDCWHWQLRDVWRLPTPIQVSGLQKLWRPTQGLVDAVRAQEPGGVR
jgi:hypothetical protein